MKGNSYKKQDLVAFIEKCGVELKDMGTYFSGLCPFHDDHNPSFLVYPNFDTEMSRFYCMTCFPEGGDIITFHRKMFNSSFVEARDATCLEVELSQAAIDNLVELAKPVPYDYVFLSKRMHKKFMALPYEEGIKLFYQIDLALSKNQFMKVEKLLNE